MKLGAKISVSMILLALLATLIAAWLAGFTIRRSFDEYVDRNLYYRLDGVEAVWLIITLIKAAGRMSKLFLTACDLMGVVMGIMAGRQVAWADTCLMDLQW